MLLMIMLLLLLMMMCCALPSQLHNEKPLFKFGTGLSAGCVLVFETPPSAFPSYARNVPQVTPPPHLHVQYVRDMHTLVLLDSTP